MTNIYYIRNAKIINNEYITKKEKDLSNLYNYLKSRDFTYFPNQLERKNGENKYQYIEDFSIDNEQKAVDLIDIVSLLHNKTSYQKDIAINKNIYLKLKGHIRYLREYYESLFIRVEEITNPTPSEQLFLYNYSKLSECLDFLNKEIESWYKLVKDKKSERVAMIHGKLSIEHIIKNDKTYLISWDEAHIETPIVDVIKFYRKEWHLVDFKNILERYFAKTELSESEKKLLFINITIPIKFVLSNDEIDNAIEMHKFFEYIYYTENLIRPYYSKE